MTFPVVLMVIGLFHVTTANFSSFCKTNVSNPRTNDQYFELDVDIPRIGTYEQNTFKKNHEYLGTFVAKRQLDSVIVQARTTNELRYGRFLPSIYDVFTAPTCVYQNDSLFGSNIQPNKNFEFIWHSEEFTSGDIQFWVGISDSNGDYFWVEGPKYRASTDYDSNDKEPTGESNTHKFYYIVLPSVLLAAMIIMIVGSMMVFSKVKYGTICCCCDWSTPITYRYALKYSMRHRKNLRSNVESTREQPPSYDNAVQEENKIARQNVARYAAEIEDSEDITDDRAPLTGP